MGTLPFGSVVDDPTSFALLDRFVERGGTFVDTANCYCFWRDGSDGGDSERLVGRWLADRGLRDEITVATKIGALPSGDGEWPGNREGLAAATIRTAVAGSLRRLGRDTIDLLYGHIDDPATPLEESTKAFAQLVSDGLVDEIGMSNQSARRFARARDIAHGAGLPAFTAIQQRHTYLAPAPKADFDYQVALDDTMLTYAAAHRDVTVLAYSSLLNGAYAGSKPVPPEYRHDATVAALRVLGDVAREVGATPGQVVYAWMLQGTPMIVPLVGVSTLAQLDEALDAVDLKLSDEHLQRLDAVRTPTTGA
ncbi:aldo/keto reductase [Streptomyces sp. NPDC040750]|uniref:aldo/keto reductase n=1 Tax=Streptomyces sp. NPDC040750 TaxID=3154491 RepID=UPI0033E07ABC